MKQRTLLNEGGFIQAAEGLKRKELPRGGRNSASRLPLDGFKTTTSPLQTCQPALRISDCCGSQLLNTDLSLSLSASLSTHTVTHTQYWYVSLENPDQLTK